MIATAAGPHSVVAVYTPPPRTTTYHGSTSALVTFTEAAPACNSCTDVQTIDGTVPAGTLAISTPYTPANPLNLGTIVIDSSPLSGDCHE
jgi:hypothetical protein